MILPQFFDNPFIIRLSFHKIIERYEAIAAGGESLAAQNARSILKEVSAHPELRDGITDISQILDNAALISRLVAELFPAALTKNEIKAISTPFQGLIFNYTERFRNILHDAGPGFDINIRDFDSNQFYVFTCGIILNNFYGTRLDFNKPLFYDIPAANGTMKYYRILYNIDFMEIFPIGKTPELTPGEIRQLLDSYNDIALWKEKFPPGSWLMKGFTIMTLVDVTIQNAVSILKDNLLGKSSGNDLRQILSSIFRSIFQVNDINVGFTLYQQVTGKISSTSFGQKIKSFVLPDKEEDDLQHLMCDDSYNVLIKQQGYFAVADTDYFLTQNPDNVLAKVLKKQNINSFILAPVVKDKSLLGFIELVSSGIGEFNSVNATKLDLVMPYLVEALSNKISEFQNRVMAVIQNNYTSLHPSVTWKFEREAKNYIKNQEAGLDYNIKEIRFKQVFPLYGQVDIRNSSVTRNLSIQSDLENQLVQLTGIFEQLTPGESVETRKHHLDVLQGFLDDITDGIKADTEQSINHYLEVNIYPLLKPVEKFEPDFAAGIGNYFKQIDSLTGEFYTNRRNYEKTLTLVNDKLLDILDKRQAEIQQFYPHYYERFKTDGVEHNLYAGSAITPDKEFSPVVLQRLRLWQLLVTAEMEMEQFRLKSILPYHLGVTTLILVFTAPIDIRFRMDEKHFDIDGAYNIRYEVIKKRIDKAFVKGTQERITHRGKITIVYSKKEEEDEYLKYLGMLQAAGIIENKTEKIDVEDLQGVSGLKALRAAILYDERLLLTYDRLYEELYKKLT